MKNILTNIKNEAAEKISKLQNKKKVNEGDKNSLGDTSQILKEENFEGSNSRNSEGKVKMEGEEAVDDLEANQTEQKNSSFATKFKKIKEDFIEKGEKIMTKVNEKTAQFKEDLAERSDLLKTEIKEKISKEKIELITKINETSVQIKESLAEKSNLIKAEIMEKIDQKKEYFETQKEKILVMKNNLVEQGEKLTNALEKELKSKMDGVKEQIINEMKNIDAKFLQFLKSKREKINKYLSLKIQEIILNFMKKNLRPYLKKALKDPDMCLFVRKFIDDFIDEIYPGIEEEIRYRLKILLEDPTIEVPNPTLIFNPYNIFCYFNLVFRKFRAWYLYTTNPYDKSIWAQIKWFSWWVLLLISMFPYYGVQPFFFVFVFFMIDKSDEYQLVQYILGFKKMIFITAGVENGMIGYILYFVCATLNDYKTADDYKKCFVSGPGADINYFTDLTSFFLQILLVWSCFFLLPFSRAKGKPKFKYTLDESDFESNNCLCCPFVLERGGRLKAFLIYDLIISGISIGCFFIFFFGFDLEYDEYAKAIIFFCKIIYGVLSFPFMIFAIPFMTDLLTKARPTAYDKHGNCVPSMKVKHVVKKIKENTENPTDMDILEIFDEKTV